MSSERLDQAWIRSKALPPSADAVDPEVRLDPPPDPRRPRPRRRGRRPHLPRRCAPAITPSALAADTIRAGKAVDIVVIGAAETLQELAVLGLRPARSNGALSQVPALRLESPGSLSSAKARRLLVRRVGRARRFVATRARRRRSAAHGMTCDALPHYSSPPRRCRQHRGHAPSHRPLRPRALGSHRLRQRARHGHEPQRHRRGEGHARGLRRPQGVHLEHEEHARPLHGRGLGARGHRLRDDAREGHLPAHHRLRDA